MQPSNQGTECTTENDHIHIKPYEVPPLDNQRNTLTKIYEIDNQLDNGKFKCFHIYMYICLILGTVSVIVNLAYSTKQTIQNTNIWLSALLVIWFLLQYIFQIFAFRRRRQGFANIAVFLFVINFFLLVLVVIIMAVFYHSFISSQYIGQDDEIDKMIKKVLLIVLIYFVVLSALQLFINIPGSIKVRKLLKKRRALGSRPMNLRIECPQL